MTGGVDPDARVHVLARLAAGPARLAALARQVTAVEAGAPPPGEWSAQDVVAHLAAVEAMVIQGRLRDLDAGGNPTWTWTEPGPLADPEAASLEGALAVFARHRAATLATAAGLDEAGWARWGTHATFGRLDVAGVLRVAADHDDEHLGGLEARRG